MSKKVICRYCKEIIDFCYFEPINVYLNLIRTCFICDFWITKIPGRQHIRTVIFKDNHYSIGQGGGDPKFRGFSGRKWKIVFQGNHNLANEKDKTIDSAGRILQSIVYTSDLWHQGRIPERFKEYLPDNAIDLCGEE